VESVDERISRRVAPEFAGEHKLGTDSRSGGIAAGGCRNDPEGGINHACVSDVGHAPVGLDCRALKYRVAAAVWPVSLLAQRVSLGANVLRVRPGLGHASVLQIE
jgi:hypothetical protein